MAAVTASMALPIAPIKAFLLWEDAANAAAQEDEVYSVSQMRALFTMLQQTKRKVYAQNIKILQTQEQGKGDKSRTKNMRDILFIEVLWVFLRPLLQVGEPV